MRSHAWREGSGMSGLAGPLIMAASASLLGYWLYHRRTSGRNQPAGGYGRPSGDDRIPDDYWSHVTWPFRRRRVG